jgi:hypothetical protein
MTKEEAKEMEELSVMALGHKYAYKKLRRTGVVMRQTGPGGIPRRHPLTYEQAKDYMLKRTEMFDKLRKDIEENAKKTRDAETEGTEI